MAEKRPGGLTALAVINFVFAGLGVILLLGVLALLGTIQHTASENGVSLDDGTGPGVGVIYGLLGLGVIRELILLAAGVGYLKQAKFLGRTLGNVYAVLALADTAISVGLAHSGFGVGSIIGLVYPVLTLILVNTTFKDDLVN